MATYYADVKTKDGKLGTIVIADDPDDVIGECLMWQTDNKLLPQDIETSKMILRETGEMIGTVSFEEHGVVFSPRLTLN